jgi:hypothetical protein
VVRLFLLFSLVLAFSGCFQLSKASRDDEEEWGAKWGTEDVKGGKKPAQEEKVPEKPAISDKDRSESFIPLPPPSPMEGKQPARPATPKTREPAPSPPPREQPVVVANKKPKKKKLRPEEPPVEEPPPPEPKPIPPPVMYPEEAREKKPVPGVSQPSPSSALSVPGSKFEGAPAPERKPPSPPPRREVVVTPAVSPSSAEPLFMLEVVGGVLMIPRGTRFQPGGGVGFGLNLGKLAGWKGLYLTADVDVLVGERQLYADTYLLLDGLIGVQGRIPVWKLKIIAGLGFGMRFMILTGGSGDKEPDLGFGAAALAGVEVPLTELLSAVVLVDGRYMKEPEFGSFHLTSMFAAGVAFSF